MKTFVISLARTPERLAEFTRCNARHKSIESFPATDGRQLDLDELRNSGLVSGSLPYTPGAIGNALSHRALWVYAAEKGKPITICEDDALLHDDFEPESERLLQAAPEGWDVILWGWNYDRFLIADTVPSLSPVLMRFDQAMMRANKGPYLRGGVHPALFRLYACFGTVCYSISPTGARRYLDACFPLRDQIVTVPEIDYHVRLTALDGVMCSLYRSSNSLVCFPPLAVTDNDHSTSTVQTARPAAPSTPAS